MLKLFRRLLVPAAFSFLFPFNVFAVDVSRDTEVIYTPEDSVRTETLLKSFADEGEGSPVMFFAHKLCGIPYVGGTLEVGDNECLVVNMRQMDCTTLVENVVALSMASISGKPSFGTFCSCLEKLRYYDGKANGYPSRKHYFSEWISDNARNGIVSVVTNEYLSDRCPFISRRKVNVNYMSTHPSKYKRLKNSPELVDKIRENEKSVNGSVMYYVPSSCLGKDSTELDFIKDGDILAIVTSKAGLDISHVGFAVWKDGRLHLLNASSVYGKVHLDKKPLYDYMKANRSGLGVVVIRPLLI